jgi:DNA ligase-associated metallophosphoesterase
MSATRAAAHLRAGGAAVPPIPARGRAVHEITVNGTALVADPAGGLYWPDEKLLAVADLHLEKGSAFAARGVLLPPYDTTATLARLSKLIEYYQPALVVALGDSFHDHGGPARMPEISRSALCVLQRGRDWLWLAGNHDPDPPQGVGGRVAAELAIGSLTFRHEPLPQEATGEIAGHLHPMARVAQRGRGVARRCFAADGKRIVMPAFGAYAGGLNVRDRAFLALFGVLSFTAHLLGAGRLYAIPAARCMSD